MAAFADGHDRGGQCCLVLLLFKAGKKAGDYLRCYHGLLYRTLVAASTALCLGLGGIATSDIEQSSGMLKVTQRKLEKARLTDRVELHCGDALSLPYRDNTLDAVLMSLRQKLQTK